MQNIGAYVGSGSMIDTWATGRFVRAIGKGVHLSGGAGIGGVLEPPTASPVIIEDGAFIGSRCVVVEGVVVERSRARRGRRADIQHQHRRRDRPRTRDKQRPSAGAFGGHPRSASRQFPAGVYHVPCALIIGRRSASTDQKLRCPTRCGRSKRWCKR